MLTFLVCFLNRGFGFGFNRQINNLKRVAHMALFATVIEYVINNLHMRSFRGHNSAVSHNSALAVKCTATEPPAVIPLPAMMVNLASPTLEGLAVVAPSAAPEAPVLGL
jgi:hypothetical protein